MSRTLICTNTLTVINQIAYANHCQFYSHLARKNPNDFFALFTPVRMTIDSCRNAAVRTALENEMDYVMFIDDDVLLPFDAYNRLKSHDKDVVAGWTVIRGYPFNNMFFRFIDGDKTKGLEFYNDLSLDATELCPVDAVGCSCVLIKCELLKKLSPPYFLTGSFNTEDIYFCMKAKEQAQAEIFVDPLVKTPHLLAMEAVTPENRLLLKKFVEDTDSEVLKPPEGGDRGNEYLDMIGGV
jgi:hypothetical protein